MRLPQDVRLEIVEVGVEVVVHDLAADVVAFEFEEVVLIEGVLVKLFVVEEDEVVAEVFIEIGAPDDLLIGVGVEVVEVVERRVEREGGGAVEQGGVHEGEGLHEGTGAGGRAAQKKTPLRGAMQGAPGTGRILRKARGGPSVPRSPAQRAAYLSPLTISGLPMLMFDERSAYPHPDEFKVMRPEYSDPEEEGGEVVASIVIAAFRVNGRSATRSGARRAALYEAAKTYRNYHPGYRIESPFPDEFTDESGTRWQRIPEHQRTKLGDYTFVDEEGEDSADIEQMLMWDVRPAAVEAEEGGEE